MAVTMSPPLLSLDPQVSMSAVPTPSHLAVLPSPTLFPLVPVFPFYELISPALNFLSLYPHIPVYLAQFSMSPEMKVHFNLRVHFPVLIYPNCKIVFSCSSQAQFHFLQLALIIFVLSLCT